MKRHQFFSRDHIIVGNNVGELSVLSTDYKVLHSGQRKASVVAKCSCGNIVETLVDNIVVSPHPMCKECLINIATLSDGEIMSGKEIETYREKRQKIRSSLQSKGTKGSKKVLKRLSGKEKRTASIVNHTIAKRIVAKAFKAHKGIALEKLKGIRKSANNKGKKFRSRIGKWNFADLRAKIEYKAKLSGVPVVAVKPAYTSQTCSRCHNLGSRNGESFKCPHCSFEAHADVNAAKNIGAAVNLPEKSVKGHLAPNQV